MVDAAKAAEILLKAHLEKTLLDDIPDDCKPATQEEALEVENILLKHLAITVVERAVEIDEVHEGGTQPRPHPGARRGRRRTSPRPLRASARTRRRR